MVGLKVEKAYGPLLTDKTNEEGSNRQLSDENLRPDPRLSAACRRTRRATSTTLSEHADVPRGHRDSDRHLVEPEPRPVGDGDPVVTHGGCDEAASEGVPVYRGHRRARVGEQPLADRGSRTT